MKRNNILIVCDRLDFVSGGLERYVIDQANGLSKNNNITLCANSIVESVQKELISDIALHYPWNQQDWNLTKFEIKVKPDIVHCHPFSAYNIGFQIAVHFGAKLFCSHHGPYNSGFGNDAFGIKFSKKVKKVFCVDYAAKDVLSFNSVCPMEKLDMLFNSLDIDKFYNVKANIDKLNLKLNKNKKNLVLITRLEDNKEIPVKKIISIADRLKKYNVVIVGGGLFESEIRKKIKDYKNIHMVGAVDNPQDYMAIADLCLCSARTAIEAVLVGKNVLQMGIGKFGGFVDINNYKSTLFNIDSYKSYTDNELFEIIDNHIDLKSDLHLQEIIKKECDIKNAIKKLEDNYREALNE